MMTKEAREARWAFWLQHWRECEAAGEGMAAYARQHELDADEGYRWKRILRRAQRWPQTQPSVAVATAVAARKSVARFARVRITAPRHGAASLPVRLQLLLVNGRRAELMLEDVGELARALSLLEQPG